MLLTDLFAASVAAHADLPAIDAPPGRDRPTRVVTTYRELARQAAGVAGALAPHVRDESLVVVLLPRHGASLYAATIGVLQAGAAYVGVDPAFPDAHLGHVVRDGRVAAIVTDAAGAPRARGFGVPVVTVPAAGGTAAAVALRPRPRGDRSLAYAIYTSGTTGAPKGVLVEHRGVVNLVRSGVERFGIGPTDRIAQGSSPAYDSSVEETWLALAGGACVVVLDDDTVRLGPDLTAWLRRERVTVFCPPPTLLRAMDVASPRAELPDLRLCYVGGEALPQDLADRWGGELWLENGYGPTECSVTVVRGRVRPGAPVTIGAVVAPNSAHVLDAALQPVAGDDVGELCIAGPSLARGYLGQPELTAQRFPELPGIGRVYRTGDLVQRLPGGELRCLGRVDAQVKVRGHRIELEAVEAVLARCPGVREVACTVQDEGGENVLVAHVVAADATAPDDAALAAAVRAALPAAMVPARFGRLPVLPRTIGGKVHRPGLPRLAAAVAANGSAWQPANAAERALRDAFAAVLRLDPAAIAADSDFFALGGDSLRAALLVSSLRRGGELHVAVRDVYDRRTPVALAAAATKAAEATGATAAGATAATPRPLPPVPWRALGTQVAFLAMTLAAASAVAWCAAFVLLPWLADGVSLTAMLLLGPWLAAAGLVVWTLVATWIAVVAKEVLIGRYVPTRVPAWSSLHVRHWVVVRLVRLVPWSLLAGTTAQHAVLRALGARIGRRVHIHRAVDLLGGGWDLLELGDDVTLQRETELVTCELDDGDFVVGAVRIDEGATLQTRAGVGPGVHVGRGAVIGALSFVPSGSVVPPGERRDGVPASRSGDAMAAPAIDVVDKELAPWAYTVLLLGARFAWAPLIALPLTGACWLVATAAGVDFASLVAWLCGDGPWSRPAWVFVTMALAVAAVPLSLLAQALVLRVMPAVPNGTHARWSWLHLRLQVRTELVESASDWLSGTLFWPAWLALAGMRIGRGCEISTILDALPETVRIGEGSFLADGVYLGVPAQHQGTVTVAAAELGARTFVGNHAVIAGGQRLPDDLVLGVSTVADDVRMRGGGGWFGQPAFALPNREVVVVDRRLTHDPGPLRYANRWLWEASRVLLPLLPVALGLWWCDYVAEAAADDVAASLARAIVATAACGGGLVFVVWALKWLLLGRVRPGQHGLWSCWASRWDFHYVLWQRYGRPFLQPFEGTLLLPWFLRAMGMRVGRRCVLGDGFAHVVDPDMISIGDGATVHALFQAHSFEDRVLKIDRVRIGAGATVGRGTVVLYGADIGERAQVQPHGVVMKHELLLPHRTYAGAPTIERPTAEPSNVPAAVPAAASALVGPAGREAAFDVARGCAVLGMFWLHLVPETDGGVIAWSLWALEGVPAALFFVLAGAAWGSAGTRAGDDRLQLPWPFVLRRSLALAVAGVLFWRWLWPNDVLAPFALALLCSAAVLRGGRLAIAGTIAVLLAAVPLATAAFGTWVENDLLEDGTHLANHTFGWCTLRWYLFDGAYPLLPWLALPLLGAAVALGGPNDAARALRWMWLGLAAQAMAVGVDALTVLGGDEFELLAPYTAVTWQPTSVPFVLSNGGLALLVIGVLRWRAARRGLPNWTAPFAALGRLSLTHYVGHVALVYTPLRLAWPDEDWPLAVGVAAAVGYAVVAVASSAMWVRRGRRGLLEALLRFASGPSRSG